MRTGESAFRRLTAILHITEVRLILDLMNFGSINVMCREIRFTHLQDLCHRGAELISFSTEGQVFFSLKSYAQPSSLASQQWSEVTVALGICSKSVSYLLWTCMISDSETQIYSVSSYIADWPKFEIIYRSSRDLISILSCWVILG